MDAEEIINSINTNSDILAKAIEQLSQATDDGIITSIQILEGLTKPENIAGYLVINLKQELQELTEGSDDAENVRVFMTKETEKLLLQVQMALDVLKQKAATSDEVPESDWSSEEVFESGPQDGAEDNVSEDHDNPDYLESSKTIQENIVEITALQKKIQQQDAVIRQLQQSYEDDENNFEKEIATLTDQLQQLNTKLKENNHKLSAFQGTEQDIHKLHSENEKLKKQQQEQSDASKGLKKEKKDLEASINSLSAQYDELLSKLNTAEQEGARVRQAFESREEEQEQKQTQLNEMQEALRDKEALIAQLQEQIQSFALTVRQLEEEAQKSPQDIGDDTGVASKLSSDIELERLKEELSKKKHEHENALSILRQNLKDLTWEQTQLSTNFAQETAKAHQLNQKLISTTVLLESAESRAAQMLQKEISTLNSEHQAKEKQLLLKLETATKQSVKAEQEAQRKLEEEKNAHRIALEKLEQSMTDRDNNAIRASVLVSKVSQLDEQLVDLNEKLKDQENRANEALANVEATQQELAEATKQSESLKQEIARDEAEHAQQVSDLRTLIDTQKDESAQAKQDLVKVLSEHEAARSSLNTQLTAAQSMTARLNATIQQQAEELNSSKSTVTALESQLSELSTKNSALTTELETSQLANERQKAEFTAQLTEQQQKMQAAQTELNGTKEELTQASEENKKLQTQVRSLTEINSTQALKVGDLSQKVNELTDQNTTLTAQLKTEKSRADKASANVEATQKELAEAQHKSESLTKKISEASEAHAQEVSVLKDKIKQGDAKAQESLATAQSEHAAALSSLQAKLSEVESNTAELNSKIEQQSAELSSSQDNVKALQSELSELSTKNSALTEELETSKRTSKEEQENLTAQLVAQQQTIEENKTQIHDMQAKLTETTQNNDRLKQQVSTLQSENQHLKSSDTQLNAKVNELTAQNKTLTQQFNKEKSNAAAVLAEVDATKQALSEAKAESSRLEKEISDVTAAHAQQVSELQQQINQKNGESEQAKQRLKDTRVSYKQYKKELQATLRETKKTIDAQSVNIKQQSQELIENTIKITELQNKYTGLNTQINSLTQELETSKQASEQKEAELTAQLTEQQQMMLAAQTSFEETQRNLAQATATNQQLNTQVNTLQSQNQQLTDKVNQLIASEAEARQELAQKDVAIKLLYDDLKKVKESKAIAELTLEIQASKDPGLLRKVIQTISVNNLKNTGLDANKVHALNKDATVLNIIKNAAQIRLAELRQEALKELEKQVGAGDEKLLNQVKSAINRDSLVVTGLPKRWIDCIEDSDVVKLSHIATSRLDNNTQAIALITSSINQSEDIEFLQTIIKAQENSHLTVGGVLKENDVKNLVNPKEYETFVKQATTRLNQLKAPTVGVRQIANILIQTHGVLDGFTDEKATTLNEGLPTVNSTHTAGTAVASVITSGSATYLAQNLESKALIRSHKTYVTAGTKVSGVALLTQDANGVVTDKSYGTLTKEQQTEIAFKQAQMFLLNYQSSSQNKKEIYIRGSDEEMSNKVFAALLVLKQNDPSLKDVTIHSLTRNCHGPEYKWHTRHQVAENNFIDTHLESSVLKANRLPLSKQSAESRRVLYSSGNGEPLKNLHVDDSITSEGLVTQPGCASRYLSELQAQDQSQKDPVSYVSQHYKFANRRRTHHQEASISDDFKDLKQKYQALTGDTLKAKILSDFKGQITQTGDLDGLTRVVEHLKATREYQILARGQGRLTQKMGLKTSSVVAFDEIVAKQKEFIEFRSPGPRVS